MLQALMCLRAAVAANGLNVNVISLNGRHWSGYAIGANLSAGVAAMPDTLAVGLHPKPVKISQII